MDIFSLVVGRHYLYNDIGLQNRRRVYNLLSQVNVGLTKKLFNNYYGLVHVKADSMMMLWCAYLLSNGWM